MPMVDIIGGTLPSRSRDESSKRVINFYPEKSNGKSGKIYVGTAGTSKFVGVNDLTTGQCRGLYYASVGRLFCVFGELLIEVDSTGTIVDSYNIGLQSTKVSITDNGYYLILADGLNMWSLEFATDTFDEVLLPFSKPTQVTYFKQRLIAINGSSTRDDSTGEVPEDNKFYFSDVGPQGFKSWEPQALNWASAEQNADPINSMAKIQGELWFFGINSYEVWVPSPNPSLPLSFRGGSASNIGCGAPDSVAEIKENIFWLGSSKAGKNVVYMSQGYNAVRISNHAIEYQLGKVETSNAVGFTYQEEGHTFYVLNLISSEKTYVFDLETGEWHERASRDPILNISRRWSPMYAVYAFDKVITGNSSIPYLLTLDLDTYTEFDPNYSVGGDNQKPIVRTIQTTSFWDGLNSVVHDELAIDVDVGHGLQNNNTAGVGQDPQLMLDYSDDGGYTFKPQQWRSIGKIGKYKQRVRFLKLGMSRERVYRISISDPVKVVILGARLSVRKGLR